MPAWVIFAMIIVAGAAICAAVTMRTHSRRSMASQQYARMQSDVDGLRNTNETLRVEIEQLRSDPRTIEAAVRTRLNMVRANEIVVPVE